MRGKKIADWITVFFVVGCLLSLLYAVAVAVGINRIVGSNVVAGLGLVLGTDGKDTVNVLEGRGLKIDTDSIVVLCGWGLKFDGDSLEANATSLGDSLATLWSVQTIVGTKTFTSASGVIIGVGGTDGKLTLFAEDGGTDHSTIFQPGTQTQNITYTLPVDDGTTNQYLQTDGSGVLTWATPTGSGDMLKATYDVAVNSVVDDVDTVGTQIAAALSHRAYSTHTHTGVDSTWITDVGIGYQDLASACIESVKIKAGSIGYGNLASACVESTKVKAASLCETNMTWRGAFWGGADLSIRTGVTSQLSVYYPLANDSVDFFVRNINEGALADQIDTIVFSGFLPVSLPDIDSITFNMRSTDTDTAASGLKVRIGKRTTELAPITAVCDTMKAFASSSANAWRHITVAGTKIDAVAGGNEIRLLFIALGDPAKMVDYTKPRVWYVGK